jgi:hypothetical protein
LIKLPSNLFLLDLLYNTSRTGLDPPHPKWVMCSFIFKVSYTLHQNNVGIPSWNYLREFPRLTDRFPWRENREFSQGILREFLKVTRNSYMEFLKSTLGNSRPHKMGIPWRNSHKEFLKSGNSHWEFPDLPPLMNLR